MEWTWITIWHLIALLMMKSCQNNFVLSWHCLRITYLSWNSDLIGMHMMVNIAESVSLNSGSVHCWPWMIIGCCNFVQINLRCNQDYRGKICILNEIVYTKEIIHRKPTLFLYWNRALIMKLNVKATLVVFLQGLSKVLVKLKIPSHDCEASIFIIYACLCVIMSIPLCITCMFN